MENTINKLYFNTREWTFNPLCEKSNKGERTFISSFNESLTEVYTLGNWDWDNSYTEIISKQLALEKNSNYTFTFWLNGGENDCANEICQLHIIFNNDEDSKNLYKLNRDFVKPIKRYKGWLLYEIPFSTGDNEYTQLKFVAMRAYMTVMPAKDKEAYANLPDEEPAANKPQRSNIIFTDGWPKDKWYGNNQTQNNSQNNNSTNNFENFDFNPMYGMDKIMENIKSSILDNIDFDEISENISDEFGEEISNRITNDIRNSIKNNN